MRASVPGGVAMQGSSADTGLVAVSEDAVSGSWDGSVAVMPKVAVLLCTWFTGGEACGSIAMGGAPCSVCNDVSSNSTGAAGDAAAGSDNGGAVSGEGGRALSMTFSPETASSWTGEKASVPGGWQCAAGKIRWRLCQICWCHLRAGVRVRTITALCVVLVRWVCCWMMEGELCSRCRKTLELWCE